ncbi:MAG: hypothetical protein PHS93_10200 [Candidatus Omnitrophica bacterium]|nr:hypothetical protein [Candidatus Omnitrophota bacterium]MDD5353521.1 hypothetical protein [Candidatus Omnitrophota bacterium]
MKPIEFKGTNVIIAKDQPEYTPLPAYKVGDDKGTIVFCESLSIRERIKILFTGKLWCSFLTFNKPVPPSFFTVDKWVIFNKKIFKSYLERMKGDK